MKKFDYLFFDCMETLIDLEKLPTMRDYAAWAFYGSDTEELWEDFDEFFRYYLLAKQELYARLPEHADYEMRGRFLHLTGLSLSEKPYSIQEQIADKLYKNYWNNYKSGSYVKEDVLRILPQLRKQYRMGVVSNFMVMGGIEEMLEMHDIRKYFDFVVTSVAEGWRKPHPAIYSKALGHAGVKPERVVFVGDDFINDYQKPYELGMSPIYLDRYGKHPELESRIADFYELKELLPKE